jgi:hypothetical protein
MLTRCRPCASRWHNHLCPSVNKEEWTEEEDQLIMELVQQMGTKWSKIVKMLPGRTDNAIKNRWNGTLSKAAQEAGQVPGQPTVLSGLCLAASLETDPSPECN